MGQGKGTKRLPYAELRARQELATRALDDARALLVDADPDESAEGRAERERRAAAIFGELSALLPVDEPLSAAERERLERELADMPDDETLRAMLLEMMKLFDDPRIPDELKAKIPKEDIHEALAALDEVALLTPLAHRVEALAEDLRSPRKSDPGAALLRRETEKQAAKRRS